MGAKFYLSEIFLVRKWLSLVLPLIYDHDLCVLILAVQASAIYYIHDT